MAYLGVPPGVILPFAGPVAPVGFLLCDASNVSRSVYADLFAAIGTTHGAGDGSSTFGLPDGRGRALYGQGSHADVGTLGNNEGAAVGTRRPKHKHVVNDNGHVHTIFGYTVDGAAGGAKATWQTPGGQPVTTDNGAPQTTGITIGPQTGNEPTDTPPYLVVQHIIKY